MYEAVFTTQFNKSVKKLKLDENTKQKLKDACNKILQAPLEAKGQHWLKHEWVPNMAADFDGRRNIIYRVCSECIRLNHRDIRPLICCSDPDSDGNRVTFIDFGDYHKNAGREMIVPLASYQVPIPIQSVTETPDNSETI